MEKVIQYNTQGTCCKLMQVKINEDEVITDVNFLGGWPGNLRGISLLVKGMKIDDVISKFSGIRCGDKPTSCPDQLAKCLSELKAKV
uniref:TIGR03905 family TSCPD domain-containing protein n=1 Tax=Candidatus Stercorousia sp. TaxID=3048886 RepID=UPI004026F7B2